MLDFINSERYWILSALAAFQGFLWGFISGALGFSRQHLPNRKKLIGALLITAVPIAFILVRFTYIAASITAVITLGACVLGYSLKDDVGNAIRGLRERGRLLGELIVIERRVKEQDEIAKQWEALVPQLKADMEYMDQWRHIRTAKDGPALSTEDLRNKVSQLELSLKFREESIASLKEINSALADQLKSKFTFVQAIVSLVTFLFVINFGYQVWKTEDVKQVGQRAQDALKQVNSQRAEINHQGIILAEVAQATADLNNSQRALSRRKYNQAIRKAEAVCRVLEGEFEQLDQRLSAKVMEANQKGLSQEAQDQLQADIKLLKPMHAAVQNLLLSAYDMAAFSYAKEATEVVLKDKPNYFADMNALIRIGNRMIEIDKKRWEPYHYIGLASGDLTNPVSRRWPQAAIKAYETSIALDRDVKVDLINLAEWSFQNEIYDVAQQRAEEYLTFDPKAPEGMKRLCHFFSIMSEYMLKGDVNPVRTLAGQLKDKRDFSETYVWEDLDELRKKIDNELSEKSKKNIRLDEKDKRKKTLSRMLAMLVKHSTESDNSAAKDDTKGSRKPKAVSCSCSVCRDGEAGWGYLKQTVSRNKADKRSVPKKKS